MVNLSFDYNQLQGTNNSRVLSYSISMIAFIAPDAIQAIQ